MTDPKPPTHNAAREIVRNAELYTLSAERLGELLAYIAAAEQIERKQVALVNGMHDMTVTFERVERERDKLEAKLTAPSPPAAPAPPNSSTGSRGPE